MNSDNKGISLLFINTCKGAKIFDFIRKKLNVKRVQLDDCKQPNLSHPSELHYSCKKFEHYYSLKGFEFILNYDFEKGFDYKLYKLFSIIRRKFDRLIDKIHK